MNEQEQFAAALGPEVGGHVEGSTWTCVCGSTSTEASETAASMALYFHRRSGHQDVAVEFLADGSAAFLEGDK